MVPSKQFCVLVGSSEILIDKSAGSMQRIVATHLTVILSVNRIDSSSETVKRASCGSPTDCHRVPTE